MHDRYGVALPRPKPGLTRETVIASPEIGAAPVTETALFGNPALSRPSAFLKIDFKVAAGNFFGTAARTLLFAGARADFPGSSALKEYQNG